MAELLLRVGNKADTTLSQDGDIICAFNNRRIKCVHAEMICHPKQSGFNQAGLRIPGSLLDVWYQKTHLYKFERVSRTEVKRINMFTLNEEILGPNPNVLGECMNVELYITRRKNHPRHVIFGSLGSEFWYGGLKNKAQANLDLVWNEIEAKTALREVDHRLWPLTSGEKRGWFAMSVTDFDDATATDLESSTYDEDGTIVKKRKSAVDFRNIAIISGKTIVNIDNKALEVDHRTSEPLLLSSVRAVK